MRQVELEKSNALPHLRSPAGVCRHVLAAHYLTECAHVVELGGHLLPITQFLTHSPKSVLSIDPKTAPMEANELNGQPCNLRHIARKFQEVDIDVAPGSYGLVMLGYSLKPYGGKRPDDQVLFDLVDQAKVVIIDYSTSLERATIQLPQLVERGTLRKVCQIDLRLEDDVIDAESWLGRRRFMVFEPAG